MSYVDIYCLNFLSRNCRYGAASITAAAWYAVQFNTEDVHYGRNLRQKSYEKRRRIFRILILGV